MINIPRRLRRRLALLTVAVVLLLAVWNVLLAPDSAIRLALHFNFSRLYKAVRNATVNRDGWLQRRAQYVVDLREDVGYLIKTGYGTRHRVPAQLAAFVEAGALLGEEGRSYLVVGDWTAVNETDAALLGADIHDAIKMVMDTKVDERHIDHHRFAKYRSLQEAVDAGDEDLANHIGQGFGWELDALKFIMGMDLMYERMPKKKWYIILDDDTFLIKPSLELFLSHLNPKHPYYIGNAVGDYKGRFAHGGSGVLISGAAMQRLFNHPDIVKSAYLNSLDETWGDKLVATTLQQVGVYIDERYNHHFNGESPELTRVTADRFCSPLISFHGLRGPGQMAAVGRTLATVRDPVLWGDLWQLFGPYAIQDLAREPAQRGQDHVGAGTEDERTKVWEGVETSEECRRRCGGSCLAWTWEEDKGRCLASPWMLIGSDGARGKTSGVNWSRVERLLWHCS